MDEDQDRASDEWTGSFKRPWMNPPMRGTVGAARGAWRYAMAVVGFAALVVVVVLVLVGADVLGERWAFAVIPVAIVAAAIAMVATILKAVAEGKRG